MRCISCGGDSINLTSLEKSTSDDSAYIIAIACRLQKLQYANVITVPSAEKSED